MSWWIVTGRVEWDDEDSLYVIEADNQHKAADEGRRLLADERELTEEEAGELSIYINYVVACSHQKPEPVWEWQQKKEGVGA